MPDASRSRTIAASAEDLWDVISDPHHLPRWWPRVSRVEEVTLTGTGEQDAFTEVLKTAKGKVVRADFQLVETDEQARRVMWSQQVQGTPFARLLAAAETEVRLEADTAQATKVTIELRQVLNGGFPRFGGYMVIRAARATLDEALDGLERIRG
jgi:carbon monoxide dehydrogenase subunit G